MSLLERLVTLDYQRKSAILEIEYLRNKLSLIDQNKEKSEYILVSSQLEAIQEKYKTIVIDFKEIKDKTRGFFKIPS